MVSIEERRLPDANFKRLLDLLFGTAHATSHPATGNGEVK